MNCETDGKSDSWDHYLRIGLIRGQGTEQPGGGGNGRRHELRLQGVVYDGNDEPVTDAMIEIWQSDAAGIFNHPSDPLARRG